MYKAETDQQEVPYRYDEEASFPYQYLYPHPAVTTDCVIFAFDGQQLYILLVERDITPYKGCWALPGGFVAPVESAEECARRRLMQEAGLYGDVFLEQFHTFSSPERDPRERVITVAYLALVSKNDFNPKPGDGTRQVEWFQWDELPSLAFDHDEIIATAKLSLREMHQLKPLAFRLLGEKFSMSELQRLYESIDGTSYDRRNFHRKMVSTGLLKEEGLAVENKTRPAMLFSVNNVLKETSVMESMIVNPLSMPAPALDIESLQAEADLSPEEKKNKYPKTSESK